MTKVPDWPEVVARRRLTLGGTLAFALVFGGTQIVTRTLRPPVLELLLGIGSMLAAVSAYATVRAHMRRRRWRAVEAACAEGRPASDVDWTSSRTLTRPPVLESPVPLPAYIASGVLAAALGSLAFDSTGWERVVFLGIAASIFVVLTSWVVFRGGAQVTFARFPYLVGERATFYVATTEGSPRLLNPRFLLRCVASAGVAGVRSQKPATPWTLWSRVATTPSERCPGPDEFVEVTFDIPADLPGTALHGELDGNPPVRWELLVAGRNRWGGVMETLVVPIYAPPGVPPAVSA